MVRACEGWIRGSSSKQTFYFDLSFVVYLVGGKILALCFEFVNSVALLFFVCPPFPFFQAPLVRLFFFLFFFGFVEVGSVFEPSQIPSSSFALCFHPSNSPCKDLMQLSSSSFFDVAFSFHCTISVFSVLSSLCRTFNQFCNVECSDFTNLVSSLTFATSFFPSNNSSYKTFSCFIASSFFLPWYKALASSHCSYILPSFQFCLEIPNALIKLSFHNCCFCSFFPFHQLCFSCFYTFFKGL